MTSRIEQLESEVKFKSATISELEKSVNEVRHRHHLFLKFKKTVATKTSTSELSALQKKIKDLENELSVEHIQVIQVQDAVKALT